jgi:hypothetical protein
MDNKGEGKISKMCHCHHRAQSTPAASIPRNHSAPNCRGGWGNEKTRKSYKCLYKLNRTNHHCLRRRRCISYTGGQSMEEITEYWGEFFYLSDDDDDEVKDEVSKAPMSAPSTPAIINRK